MVVVEVVTGGVGVKVGVLQLNRRCIVCCS